MSDRTTIDAIRSDRAAFDAALGALNCVVKGRSATCPWHDDQNPSASILQAPDGAWRLHCHRCDRSGDVFDLRATAGGPSVEEQLRALRTAPPLRRPTSAPPRASPQAKAKQAFADLDVIAVALQRLGRLESTFEYTNPENERIELAVFRIVGADGKKTFRQACPHDDGWILEAPLKPWPIYNRGAVRDAETVVVVEGEKCVDALESIGITATTSPCGAGKAPMADWSLLAAKRTILCPDNDETGIKHMQDVRRVLEALPRPPMIAWVDPRSYGLPEKGDLADIIAAHGANARAAVDAILAEAQVLGATVDLGRMLEDTILGRHRAVASPWPRLTELARPLLPGTVTLVCGDPGSGKSFMLLEWAAFMHDAGEPIALFELEEDRTHHLHRALAQRAANAALADLEWIAGHPGEARQALEQHRKFLDSFGPRLHERRDGMTMRDVADWIEHQARAGCRVVMIDPLSMAQGTSKPWEEDRDFIIRITAVARDTGASVVLSVHPRKGLGGRPQGVEDVAGGAALGRFAQCVLWLEKLDRMRPHSIGGQSVDVNRVIRIMKARNGPGSGLRIGFIHEPATLRFGEVGVIETGPKPKAPGPYVLMRDGKLAAAGGKP